MSDDELALRRSPFVTLAAVLGIVSHAVGATAGAQAILYFVIFNPLAAAVPWVLLVLGGLGLISSAQLSRHSAGGAWASLLIGLLNVLVNIGWLAFTVYNGLFSLAPMLATGLAVLFVPASAVALGPARRVSKARKALLEG